MSLRAALLALGVSAIACTPRPGPLDDPDRWSEGECLDRFTIEHADSPLAELRELGGWRDDFQERFPAAVIDPSTQHAVTATQALRIEGRPIAWLSAPKDAVVLDGAVFAPLRMVDATRLQPDEPQSVGRVTARGREALGDRGVLELLLRAGVIQSYWHLGADLCLRAEDAAGATYRAELDGVHHYVSQRDHEDRYGFAVTIDAAGEIAVEHRAASR